MASREAVRRRFRGARSSRSRTTSDFEILRPCDSASMSATMADVQDKPRGRKIKQPTVSVQRDYRNWRYGKLDVNKMHFKFDSYHILTSWS
jgi:hypothetical protein